MLQKFLKTLQNNEELSPQEIALGWSGNNQLGSWEITELGAITVCNIQSSQWTSTFTDKSAYYSQLNANTGDLGFDDLIFYDNSSSSTKKRNNEESYKFKIIDFLTHT